VKHIEIPLLEYSANKNRHGTTLTLRWITDAENFEMPVALLLDGHTIRVQVNQKKTKVTLPSSYEFDQLTAYYKLKKVKRKKMFAIGA
jgi:hypothetical protein